MCHFPDLKIYLVKAHNYLQKKTCLKEDRFQSTNQYYVSESYLEK